MEIPTYNEAGNIERLIEELEKLSLDLEIIVIDDNSPDGTADLVSSLMGSHSNLKLVRRPRKNGLASAILDGMKEARSENIAVMDGDMQHPPDLLYQMLDKVRKGNDLVIASRYIPGGNAGKLGFARKIVSRTATLLAHIMLRETKQVKDPLSGFFIFKKSVVSGANLNPKGYKILLEMLIKGNASSSIEIPYTFRPRFMGSSKLSIWEDLNYVNLILKLAEYRPLKFIGVGLSGVLINLGLLYLLHTNGIGIVLSAIAAIEISTLSNFAINNLWTFRSKKQGNLIIRALKYNSVSILGEAINVATIIALTFFSVHYLIADIVGIIFGFLANYLGSELFVWSAVKGESEREVG